MELDKTGRFLIDEDDNSVIRAREHMASFTAPIPRSIPSPATNMHLLAADQFAHAQMWI